MLDIKGFLLREYLGRLQSGDLDYYENVMGIYDTLTTDLGRQSFLIFSCVKPHTRFSVSIPLSQVADILDEQASDFPPIASPVYIESLRLIEAFNRSEENLQDYAQRTNFNPPRAKFHKICWLYIVINFVSRFDMENYPLVEGWDEFVLFLPQLRQSGSNLKLSFMDYVQAIREGELDKWYGYYKAYADTRRSIPDWKQMYREQLQNLDAVSLRKEFCKFNWGQRFVKEEMQRRVTVSKKHSIGSQTKGEQMNTKHLTPVKAIRSKCYECVGGRPSEVRKCDTVKCPLYPYRLGHNPNRLGIGGRKGISTQKTTIQVEEISSNSVESHKDTGIEQIAGVGALNGF